MTDLAPEIADCAPGRPAEHEYGVLYQGEFETPWDGTAAAVRLHARALAAQGVPVLLRSFSNVVVNADGVAEPVHAVGMPEEVTKEVGHLFNTSIEKTAPVIKHMVVRSAAYLRQSTIPRGALPIDPDNVEQMIATRDSILRNTILYTVWERDRVDPEIARQMSRVAECWVPCEHNRDMLQGHGVERVHVVPHPYDPSDAVLKCRMRRPHIDMTKHFYSIGRWEPRKGFVALLEAFMLAFKPGDGATLTIKYSGGGRWEGYPEPDAALAHAMANSPNGWTPENCGRHVALVGGRLPRSRIIELHFRNNIYVASSHSEAWNLPAFEAKLAGNALVHVPWGGTADFASDADVVLPYQLGPAHASYRWETGAQWATYDVADLAAALRSAKSPESFAAPQPQLEKYTLDVVGKLMHERVRTVNTKNERTRMPWL